MTFVVDTKLQEPIVKHIACPCKADYVPPKSKQKAELVYIPKKITTNFCSCVLTVKAWTGYDKPIGLAKNWPKNTTEPTPGGVVITRESWAGHVAYITEVTETTITVKEGNYRRCQFTTRIIPRDSPVVIGYWQG